ncbi:MAG TPA: tol-pal system protein YbgF [Gammaproteobacteria bacterium]|nr:tol-pal system protein YbgF [Gammaproteobacteria bacterium]
MNKTPLRQVCLIAALCGGTTGALAAAKGGAPVVALTSPVAAEKASRTDTDARLERLERMMESGALMQMFTQLEQLQQEVQRLRGELEVKDNELAGIKQRQRDLYLDVDRRLQQLERAGAAPATAVPAAAAGASTGGSSPPPATGPATTPSAPLAVAAPSGPAPGGSGTATGSERVAYQQAFELLKQGRYDDAIVAFRALLANYPQGDYADNAQYWLGEAHYVTRRFREAIKEFQKVVDTYPQSSKVPDSLLKLGYTYYELGHWPPAREALEAVVSRFPQSTAAAMAEQRLQRMHAEGH